MDITRFGVDIHHLSMGKFSHKGNKPRRTGVKTMSTITLQTEVKATFTVRELTIMRFALAGLMNDIKNGDSYITATALEIQDLLHKALLAETN
jgi:hypothetical protein